MNEQNVIATARYLDSGSIDHVINEWKLSGEEAKALKLLIGYRDSEYFDTDIDHLVGLISVGQIAHEDATLILKFDGDSSKLAEWSKIVLPVFPITGNDLLTIGYTPGKRLGEELRYLKSQWRKFNYILTKDELLEIASITVNVV